MMNYYLTDTSFLRDPAVFEQKLSLVDEARKEKILKYRFDKDRRLSLAAALLLRRALEESGVLQDKLTKLNVSVNAQGKPYLPDYPELHFNLSHSGEIALCVLADCPAGCDIQETTDIPEEMVQQFFHPGEYQQMMTLPTEQRQEFALKLWAWKEAYVKAAGLGMTGLPFDQFRIQWEASAEADPSRQDSDDLPVFVIKNGKPDTAAKFLAVPECPEGYRAAICLLVGNR